jgi:hypothetical protein
MNHTPITHQWFKWSQLPQKNHEVENHMARSLHILLDKPMKNTNHKPKASVWADIFTARKSWSHLEAVFLQANVTTFIDNMV